MDMRSEKELVERIEAYLYDELSPEERAAFEQLRREDASLDHKVVAHQDFLKQLNEYGSRKQLQAEMQAIYEKLDLTALKNKLTLRPTVIRVLWDKYRVNAAVAASVAIIAVLATMFTTGYFSKNSATISNYSALRREINNIKKSQHALIKNIKEDNAEMPSDPSRFGGTGFALSTDGYILTNFHVIKDAKSVTVQDYDGQSYKVEVVNADPAYDIAVLKITDKDFKAFKSLPYTFKRTFSDMGENVYTLGYPKDQPVYGRGYLSSNTGYMGDTTAYQVSIDANPGNSGGPLLDNKGNIIGIITGKQTQTDGAAFAVKSGYLLKSLEAMPEEFKLGASKKNSLAGLSLPDQIKKLQNYIFMVKVY